MADALYQAATAFSVNVIVVAGLALPPHIAAAAALDATSTDVGLDGVAAAVAVLTSHADGVVDRGERVTSCGAFGHAQHALDGWWDAEAEAREQRGQGTSSDERHDDEEEDLPRVTLGVVLEVAEEALELLEAALQEALTGRAFIVRRAT